VVSFEAGVEGAAAPSYAFAVLTCSRCGGENPEGARFCNACGAPLPAEPREVRKTVTVVFADLSGSTALGERLDPEALRDLMRRYHSELRAILERHGGTVEKFIGDAVMAVFGLPLVHEDDALRAVRAAAAMRAAVEALGLQVRIGVNTGDVVAGEGETLVTGDAVNVAARLEQAAAPGEILLGEQTHLLVRESVRAEPLEPLSLKGKGEPVPALRLEEVLPDVPAFTRPIDAPFVGRGSELQELETAFRQAIEGRTCRLCTVVGPPGIGKSRLARELLARADAQAVVGRCLPYGEGITYWPLAEILKQLPRTPAGILEGEARAEVIAARVTGAVGASHSVGAPEEIAWAFRTLLEALARERPLIVVVDDVQWAEPTLLDLLEYVVSFSRDTPILLLCLARPDLFEQRPSWSNPRPNASLIPLDPLSEDEAHSLADRLVATRLLSGRSLVLMVEAAEGNPLFVEQLLAMHAESGDGELEIPPTIQALLAARIDRLEPEERTVIECASVEGRMFHRGAVAELLPEDARPELGARLMTLVRKELIRPDKALFPGDDGFRFGHILIREAAYDSLPKRLRAGLHERFADWLERRAGERETEFEEVLGYHLEQALRYRLELKGQGEVIRKLGARAAWRLGRAGERAVDRGDMRAAVNLLERAAAAAPRDEAGRPGILRSLGSARVQTGEFEEADRALREAIETGDERGDRRNSARAAIERARLLLITGQAEPEWAQAEAERLIPVLEELDDDHGLAAAWLLVHDVHNWHAQNGARRRAAEHALVHARKARAGREEAEAIHHIVASAFFGLEPAAEAAARCEQILAEAQGPVVEAHARMALGANRALQDDITNARRLCSNARAIYGDLGMKLWAAASANFTGPAELAGGHFKTAESELRRSADELEEIGDKGYRATVLAILARTLSLQGRNEEAEQLVAESLASISDDVTTEIVCGGVRARIAAGRGDFETAVTVAEEALRRAAAEGVETAVKPDVYMDLAEVMRLAGRRDEEVVALREALRLYELKGNLVSAAMARSLLGATAA
jgi:class 3 adenylate cyclase/tetratricopeptide (TPR) repeat protein